MILSCTQLQLTKLYGALHRVPEMDFSISDTPDKDEVDWPRLSSSSNESRGTL